MMRLTSLLVVALLWSLTSCQSSETIELPGSSDQYVAIDHAGTSVQLVNPVQGTYEFETAAGRERDELIISRKTVDGTRELMLRLEGGKLRDRRYPKAFGVTEGPGEKVEITYTSFELVDDPICPHLRGVPTVLEGTIRITGWAGDGIMTGTFETTADAPFQITGDFRVLVP